MRRRDFLRLAGTGLAGAAITGIAGGGPLARASAPAARPRRRPPWWLRDDYSPVRREVEAFDLEVTGSIPHALDGLYVRNGSNPVHPPSIHWFLGDGMLHGIRLERGKAAWYRNHFVRTPYLEDGGDLLSGAPPGGPRNQSNVSMVWHGGRLLSLGEVGFPYEISRDDLTTVGPYDFAGRLRTAMTAHPKIDPATGRLHFFGYGFTPPYLTYHVADPDGTLVSSQAVEVAGPTMIHDFAITDRDVVFWELPVVFDLQAAVRHELPFLWDPSYGARIGVMPLGGPASAIRWVEIDPCYVFHGVNAFRDRDEVVVDVCWHETMFVGDVLDAAPQALHRWRIDTAGPSLAFRDELLTDTQIELPTVDRRLTGREHRYGWFVETRPARDTLDFAGVVRHDFRTGNEERWDPGRGRHGGEALFVPDGDRSEEGWSLVLVHDDRRDRTDLVVLDATDVAAGPVGRVHLPQRVPYGFHATWVPADA